LSHNTVAAVIDNSASDSVQAFNVSSVDHLDTQEIVVDVLVSGDITTDLLEGLAAVKGVAEENVVVDVQVRLLGVHGVDGRNAAVDDRPKNGV
jgi:hypothetical protein